MTIRRHDIRRLAAALSWVAVVACVLPGCETTEKTKPDANRPVVRASAAENAVGASGQSQLNFFDDLEIRPIAAQDDALHAILLLGTGSSGQNYEHRVLLAKRLGYVPSSFNRPGRQAVTIGEVSQMLSAVAEPKARRTQAQSIDWLFSTEILARKLPEYQGLTGAQLVSLVGGVQDRMQLAGVKRAALPDVPAPRGRGATTPNPHSLGAGSAGRGEALPDLTTGGAAQPLPGSIAGNAARDKARKEPLPSLKRESGGTSNK